MLGLQLALCWWLGYAVCVSGLVPQQSSHCRRGRVCLEALTTRPDEADLLPEHGRAFSSPPTPPLPLPLPLPPPSDDGLVEYVAVTSPSQIFDCAALCIEVFFNEQQPAPLDQTAGVFAQALHSLRVNLVRPKLLRELYQRLARAMMRTLGMPFRYMVQAVEKDSGAVLGYAEVYLSPKGPGLPGNKTAFPAQVDPLFSSADPSSAMPKIANLAVAAGARKSGIGRKLVSRCLAVAKSWGSQDEVFLTVEPSNKAALAFYFKEGFQVRTVSSGVCWDAEGFSLRQEQRDLVVLSRSIVVPEHENAPEQQSALTARPLDEDDLATEPS